MWVPYFRIVLTLQCKCGINTKYCTCKIWNLNTLSRVPWTMVPHVATYTVRALNWHCDSIKLALLNRYHVPLSATNQHSQCSSSNSDAVAVSFLTPIWTCHPCSTRPHQQHRAGQRPKQASVPLHSDAVHTECVGQPSCVAMCAHKPLNKHTIQTVSQSN